MAVVSLKWGIASPRIVSTVSNTHILRRAYIKPAVNIGLTVLALETAYAAVFLYCELIAVKTVYKCGKACSVAVIHAACCDRIS